MNPIIGYLIAINIISGTMFAWDKHCAISRKERIPEYVLHLLELLGGVISTMALMWIIRHKNRKASYFLLTWLIFSIWIALGYLWIKRLI